MKRFTLIAKFTGLTLISFASACGEDNKSKYVHAPELQDPQKTDTNALPPGTPKGDANQEEQKGQILDSKSGEGVQKPEPVVQPIPVLKEDCEKTLKSQLSQLTSVGGIILSPKESYALPVTLTDTKDCKWVVSIEKSADKTAETESGKVEFEKSQAKYIASDKVTKQFTEQFVISVIDNPKVTTKIPVTLLATGQFFAKDDGISQGAVGNVFELPTDTKKLPDFSKLTPVTTLLAKNIDVPLRNYSKGVPGLETYNQWFGIRFDFELAIPSDEKYEFATQSDDGSRLYLDTNLIVDNDGLHSSTRKTTSAPIAVTAGRHRMRLDYYQGPADSIEIMLLWKPASASTWEVVPASAFRRIP